MSASFLLGYLAKKNHGDISVEHDEMLYKDASTRGTGIHVC